MCEPIGCEPDDVRGGRSNVGAYGVRGHRGTRTAPARSLAAQELAHTIHVVRFELVEALDLVERLEFLGGAA